MNPDEPPATPFNVVQDTSTTDENAAAAKNTILEKRLADIVYHSIKYRRSLRFAG